MATIAAWLATQGASLLLGFLAKLIGDWWAQYQAQQEAEARGRANVTAAENQKAAEMTDAMANVPHPTDDDVAGRLSAGKF